MDTIRLSYPYKDLDEIWTLNNLRHLAAVNDIRLQTNGDWMSQRQLFQEIIGEDEFESPHQPDAELRLPDGGIIAVKVQMRLKPLVDLEKTLIGLLQQSQYTQIWYFAEPSVRKQVRRVCAQLVQQRDLSIEEADHLLIKWYPLALTEEDRQKQELEALA